MTDSKQYIIKSPNIIDIPDFEGDIEKAYDYFGRNPPPFLEQAGFTIATDPKIGNQYWFDKFGLEPPHDIYRQKGQLLRSEDKKNDQIRYVTDRSLVDPAYLYEKIVAGGNKKKTNKRRKKRRKHSIKNRYK